MWFCYSPRCSSKMLFRRYISLRFSTLTAEIQIRWLCLYKELYILPGTETRQLFRRMFVTLKILNSCFILLKLEELLVLVVSLTLVVLNARSPGWLWRTQTRQKRNEQTRALSRFSHSELLSSNSFRSFDYARGSESIIYFTDLCKPIKHASMLGKSTHLQVIPQQSTQTQQTRGYRHTTKNQWTFLITPHGRRL